MARQKAEPAQRKSATVVDRAIAAIDGSQAEFARRLSEYAGETITKQRIHGWKVRGIFPRDMITYVHMLTDMPLTELLNAQPRKRDYSVVDRAIRLVGQQHETDGTAALLAAELTKISDRRYTRQMVNNWQVTGRFPTDAVVWVHMLVGQKIPIKDMIPSSPKASKKRRD